MALGRLISLIERGGEAGRQASRLAFFDGEADHVIGITGAPGAGKSTLTDRLISAARRRGDAVGVLAVDPTSPFSGGAILGDRIRMQSHTLDTGVFVRSMATRGHLGGLALAAPEAIRALAACRYRTVMVETVGVGQVEVEVAGAADTTVVVVNPGWGDAVQAAKAGLLEVADVFALNKADRPGADETRRDLESMLDLSPATSGWRPPIVACVAADGDGIEDLWTQVVRHRDHLVASGDLERRRAARLREELKRLLAARLQADVEQRGIDRVEQALVRREIDPYEAADILLGS